jgi:DNA-binding MarR family transcriptional regulator
MSVRDTSKLAYNEIAPKLSKKQYLVLHTIAKAKRPVNNQEIADHLVLPINTITPRTNELLSLDKVELAFKAVFPKTGRKVCYWKPKNG